MILLLSSDLLEDRIEISLTIFNM